MPVVPEATGISALTASQIGAACWKILEAPGECAGEYARECGRECAGEKSAIRAAPPVE